MHSPKDSGDQPKQPLMVNENSILAGDTALQKRSRTLMELKKSACRTRMSYRRMLIQTLADSATDSMGRHVRFYAGLASAYGAGRVVDWD